MTGQIKQGSNRRVSVLLALLLVTGTVLWGVPAGPTPVHGAVAAKRCHTVTKKVHGKKKKVHVCAKSTRHTPTATPTPSPTPTATSVPTDAEAQTLADAVSHATDAASTEAAVKQVLGTVGIPIVSSSGQVVQAGTSNLYLYDFEVMTLAGALRAGTTQDLSTAAAQLAQLQLGPNGDPATADTLLPALEHAVTTADPTSQAGLVPFLVRDLGRDQSQSYDLGANPSPASVHLDPLQMFLIEASAVAPAITQSALSAHLRAHDSNACMPYIVGGNNTPLEQQFLGSIKGIATVVNTITGIHDLLTYLDVSVDSSTTDTQTSHFLPTGHDPAAGAPMYFTVEVNQNADVPPEGETIGCGPLQGIHIPGHGAVPGMKVSWLGLSDLEKFGPISAYSGQGDVTDSTGHAEIQFTMQRREAVPGLGALVTAGEGDGYAEVCPFDTSLLRVCVDSQKMHWKVTRHAPQGYQFKDMNWSETETLHAGNLSFVTTATAVMSGYICGDDPYTGRWHLTFDETNMSNGSSRSATFHDDLQLSDETNEGDLYDTNGVQQYDWSILPLGFGLSDPVGGPIFTQFKMLVDQSGGATVQLHSVAYSQGIAGSGILTISPTDQTVTAPITEDTTDCSASSP